MKNERLIRKFDKQARLYEIRRRKQTERIWREKLMRDVTGRVLEVAVGAGANFPYYPQGIELTAADFSPEMLRKAKIAAEEHGIQAAFILSDIESLSFPDHSFDTIVSTLSFCGYKNPLKVLDLFNKWCKPDGRILMMEHGISSNPLAGGIQHMLNPVFKRVVGCHFNRDIVKMVTTKLRIRKMEHHLLGAVHLVWAEPSLTSTDPSG